MTGKHSHRHFDRYGNCICPCSECFKAGECKCPLCAEHMWPKGNSASWTALGLMLLVLFALIFIVTHLYGS